MDITITDRHGDVPADLREYVEQKVLKLDRYFEGVQWIKVILEGHSDPKTAEIVIGAVRSNTLVAEVSDADLHTAIDLVVDKAEHQLTRYKEKLKDRRSR